MRMKTGWPTIYLLGVKYNTIKNVYNFIKMQLQRKIEKVTRKLTVKQHYQPKERSVNKKRKPNKCLSVHMEWNWTWQLKISLFIYVYLAKCVNSFNGQFYTIFTWVNMISVERQQSYGTNHLNWLKCSYLFTDSSSIPETDRRK